MRALNAPRTCGGFSVAAAAVAAVAPPRRRRHGRSSSSSEPASVLQRRQQQHHQLAPAQRLHQRAQQQWQQEVAAAQLTRALAAAPSWRALGQLLAAHPASCGAIHVSAALSRLAKLVPPGAAGQAQPGARDGVLRLVQQLLLPLLLRHAPAMGPRALANSTWALAKLGFLPRPADLAQLLGHVAAAVPAMEPQHLSSVLHALCQWHQHLTAWQQQQQQQEQQQQRRRQQVNWPAAWGADAAAGTPEPLQPQPQPAVALQALGVPAGLPHALLHAAGSALDAFESQALSNTLHAAARLGLAPSPSWQAGFWAASAARMHQAEPQHLSNMAWAAARLQLAPPPAWRRAWLARSGQLLAQRAFTAQGCSNSAWAVARLGWGPAALGQPAGAAGASSSGGSEGSASSSWLAALLAASAEHLDTASDQALANLCWALGSIARQAACSAPGEGGEQLQQQHEEPAAAAVLPHLLVAGGWLPSLLAVLRPARLLCLNTQQASNVLWGLAAVGGAAHTSAGWLPEQWLDSFVAASGPRLAACQPHEASSMLVSLARLRHSPGRSWLALYEVLQLRQLRSCSSQALSNTAWAMLRLGHAPSEAWLAALLPELCQRLALPLQQEPPPAQPGQLAPGTSAGAAFTPGGLALLLLSLVQLVPPKALPGDLWRLVGARLLLPSSSGGGGGDGTTGGSDAARLPSCFSARWLACIAGAAALADAGDGCRQLVLAALQQLAARVQAQPGGASLHDVSLLLWAAARAGLRPEPDVLKALAGHALDGVQQLASGCSSGGGGGGGAGALWAQPSAQQLQMPPPPCADPCRALGAVLYGLAVVGFYPGSVWFSAWFQASRACLPRCSAWTLALLLWGCAWLEQVPPQAWLRAWSAAWWQRLQEQREQQAAQPPPAGQGAAMAKAVGVAAAAATRGLHVLHVRTAGRATHALPSRGEALFRALCLRLLHNARRARRAEARARQHAAGVAAMGVPV